MIYTVTLNPAVDRELTVPAIEYDKVLRASGWQVDYGGKGFNVSRMLRALDTPSVALAFAGGKSGELLRDGLNELGIDNDFVWVDGETRTNVSIVTEAHDHYIKVNEPGPQIAGVAQEALVHKVQSLVAAGDWWVLAGSAPPGVPAAFYARLIAIIEEAGAHAVLDTSGDALRAGCAAKPTLIKPNDVELSQLTGQVTETSGDVIAAARRLPALGLNHAVISMGKRGALAVTAGESWYVSAPTIAEQNPIGAGDSLVAGLVYALAQEKPFAEAVRWGVACGAATASCPGTTVGNWDLVTSLLEQSEVLAPEGLSG